VIATRDLPPSDCHQRPTGSHSRSRLPSATSGPPIIASWAIHSLISLIAVFSHGYGQLNKSMFHLDITGRLFLCFLYQVSNRLPVEYHISIDQTGCQVFDFFGTFTAHVEMIQQIWKNDNNQDPADVELVYRGL
jgi:hypothetical protein